MKTIGLRKKTAILLILLLLHHSLAAAGREYRFSAEDERFLDLVEKRGFDYFLYEHHPKTGLVKDKASNFRKDTSAVASIAATGFGLSAMCVGAERGWISKTQAEKYCENTLHFFLTQMAHEHGFFYHFVHWGTGKKTNHTEISSIDTALLLAGALTAGEYFKGTEVETLARRLYERVDFSWMLNGGKTLGMGWEPRQGFLKSRWDRYNESLILYLLAVGSPAHPIPPESWQKVKKPIGIYGPHILIACPPLFTHQYSAAWVDLRNKNDGFADYFENSRTATLVNREFCIDQRKKFKTYSENIWGLTASEGPRGYAAYGAEPGGAVHDGTVAPTAAASSMPFTPEESLAALKALDRNFKDKLWGKYGFSDAFNVDQNWYSQNVLGIDQGPLVLMIENARSEFMWKYFMKNLRVQEGMRLLGFRPGTLHLTRPEQPEVKIYKITKLPVIDGNLADWDLTKPLTLTAAEHREIGEVSDNKDASGNISLEYDNKYLYVAARITDDSLVMKMGKDKIWKDDCLELFFAPRGYRMKWKDARDMQLGLSPGEWEHEGRAWAWFQEMDPSRRKGMKLKITRRADGYDLEARIAWRLLKIKPRKGVRFGFTPAIHDRDTDGSEGKLTWFFLPDGKTGKVILGKAVLEGAPATSSAAQSL